LQENDDEETDFNNNWEGAVHRLLVVYGSVELSIQTQEKAAALIRVLNTHPALGLKANVTIDGDVFTQTQQSLDEQVVLLHIKIQGGQLDASSVQRAFKISPSLLLSSVEFPTDSQPIQASIVNKLELTY